jgi:hypothetical protein
MIFLSSAEVKKFGIGNEYLFEEEEDEFRINTSLLTDLPIVAIDTGEEIIGSDIDVFAALRVFDNETEMNSMSRNPTIALSTTIRYRGSTSLMLFKKKQYKLELYKKEDESDKKNVELLGMKKETDWVLNGPLLDKTLIRNVLMYGIAREMMDWAPDTRFCELVINGEYQGVYVMTESVKVSDNRIDMMDFALLEGKTPYLLKRDRSLPGEIADNNYLESLGIMDYTLSIHYPKSNQLTAKQYDFIVEDHQHFEEVLYGNDFMNPKESYMSMIDVDSFVDYYILNEFSMNSDAGLLSTYLYKDMDGLYKLAVWDFNSAFDNYPLSEKGTDEFIMDQKSWYFKLFMDSDFTDLVVNRYRELRMGILSDDAVMNKIDSYRLELGEAIQRNDEKWGYYYESAVLGMNDDGDIRYVISYEEAISKLKETITERGKFLDENIEELYQYSILK